MLYQILALKSLKNKEDKLTIFDFQALVYALKDLFSNSFSL